MGTWLYQGLIDGRHVYWPEGYTPPVEPPVTEPEPSVTPPVVTPVDPVLITTNGAAELFAQNAFVAIGVNAEGGLGTTKNALAGVPTDEANGFLRVGYFPHALNTPARPFSDVTLQGRAIEGFEVSYKVAGVHYARANATLNGYKQMPGKLTKAADAILWDGATPEKLTVKQSITLKGNRVRIAGTLRNDTGKTLTGLRLARLIDPDQAGGFDTTNTVVSDAKATAKLPNGAVLVVTAEGASTFVAMGISVPAIMDPSKLVKLAVGTVKKGDNNIYMVFEFGDLAPGAEVPFAVEYDIVA